MTVGAVLCGARRYGDVAPWGRDYGGEVTQALGFTRGRTPCASTLHGIFKGLDIRAFERVLEGGAEEVVRDAEGP